jgi:probable phosphoglycerate mutase
MSERRLILVKHAAPEVAPAVPAAHWPLSEVGRAACRPLAERLATFAPAGIVASEEPKAAETGRLVAERLGLPFETATDLHEHDRSDVPFLAAAEWRERVRGFFAEPDALVLGRETATAAGDRFTRAVAAVLARYQTGDLAIVAHGTVISLHVARYNPIGPFVLWEQLGLPSFVVLSVPRFELREVVTDAGVPAFPNES